ncbi:hypothetical protein I7I50_05299 [Histoplasma capsulatum G186AR]|uniref:Uncharacterized protein n=1 Tax=Ajellomyces capsulatus TaxID=5037 RepID=A0A8H8D8M1_AJECA|nr:hypothetical protein I7I52_03558 [Histoplasma capsulatum]QSS75988.1 hypothetical protein I7I50_05299 [Histoplasma capsulatum G186AR]
MIPAITTGINDFIIRSDRKVPTPAMPMPDLAVPYAAPIDPKTMAAQIPAIPMKGANLGASSLSAILNRRMTPLGA